MQTTNQASVLASGGTASQASSILVQPDVPDDFCRMDIDNLGSWKGADGLTGIDKLQNRLDGTGVYKLIK